MCKILIIEENKAIMREIIELLKQHFPHLPMILHAENHHNGLALCNMHYPNLILTQVNSDQEQCFHFIENVKGIYCDVNVVLLIDEDDTQNLKIALRKRNERFILKPIDHKNFLKIMHDCIFEVNTSRYGTQMIYNLIDKIQQYRPILEHNIIEQIASNTPSELISQNLHLLNYIFHEGFIAVTPKKNDSSNIINRVTQIAVANSLSIIQSDYLNYHVILIFTNANITSSKEKRLLDEIKNINIHDNILFASDLKYDITNLYHAFIEAIIKLNNASEVNMHIDSTKNTQLFHISELQIEYYARHIFHYCLMLDDHYVTSYFRKIAAIFSIYELKTTQFLVTALIQKLINQISYSYKVNLILPSHIMIVYEHDIDEIHNVLLQFYHEALDKINEQRKDTSHLQLRKVLLDILKNYTNNQLNLHDTANRLDLSTFYICKLFKKHTDFTFIDYINDCRIEYAKTYLKTDKKIKNIAYEVGFQSTTYFGRVFKNKLGITPKEYRMQRYFYHI